MRASRVVRPSGSDFRRLAETIFSGERRLPACSRRQLADEIVFLGSARASRAHCGASPKCSEARHPRSEQDWRHTRGGCVPGEKIFNRNEDFYRHASFGRAYTNAFTREHLTTRFGGWKETGIFGSRPCCGFLAMNNLSSQFRARLTFPSGASARKTLRRGRVTVAVCCSVFSLFKSSPDFSIGHFD